MKRCQALSPQLLQCANIWFGVKLGWGFAKIKNALNQCFPNGILSDRRIYHWISEFQGGRTVVADLPHAPKLKTGRSRPNIRKVEDMVAQDR